MLVASGLKKSYGGATALAGADLTVRAGEIHALLGPNGAGKSTLIRCLSGGTTPDAGEIVIDGELTAYRTPREAIAGGIAVIHQNLSLIGPLSVTDNIFLGAEVSIGPCISRRAQRQRAQQLLDGLGLTVGISADSKVEDLPMPQRQLVEIAKALRSGDVRILILDEPTASLTEVEAQALAARLRALRERGLHIIYTTHFINEVFEVADRVTVLRDGEVAMSDVAVAETSPGRVIDAITGGRELRVNGGRSAKPPRGDLVLKVDELCGPGFGPLSLQVHAGEIVGVFGLLGSGRTELLETIFGNRRSTAGRAHVGDQVLDPKSPAAAIAAGVALVPGERLRQGIFLPLPAGDNVLLPNFRRLARRSVRRRRREAEAFQRAAENVALRPPRANVLASELSGGNQQKLIVGRWLTGLQTTRLLMLDEPTQGIDVGARADIYGTMRRCVEPGRTGILFTSADPEEVISVADRAVVLSRGQVVGEVAGAQLTETELLNLAHGVVADAA